MGVSAKLLAPGVLIDLVEEAALTASGLRKSPKALIVPSEFA